MTSLGQESACYVNLHMVSYIISRKHRDVSIVNGIYTYYYSEYIHHQCYETLSESVRDTYHISNYM